jgi:hypothetical protein
MQKTNAASTGLDLGRASDSAADDTPLSPEAAAATYAEGKVNGKLLAIESLQSLAPEERVIVRQSEVAFRRIRQTWELKSVMPLAWREKCCMLHGEAIP